MILPPPQLKDLKSGVTLITGLGVSTVLPDIDFETYSPAGYVWGEENNKFVAPHGSDVKGLPCVGAAVYSEHPDTEVLSCAYDLKDGRGARLWVPGTANPQELFDYLATGGLIEAWYCPFERWIWSNVCVPKYGWPPLPFAQLRDALAKARAFGYPGGLAIVGDILDIKNKKDKEGKRLLDKFSMPRNPTKTDARKRILPSEDPADAQLLYAYNVRDIESEAEISSLMPDLSSSELEFWMCDQAINVRGVQVDVQSIAACRDIVEQGLKKYNTELQALTGGEVRAASEIARLRAWLASRGVNVPSLDSDTVESLLASDNLPKDAARALKIRQRVGSAAVKKVYAMTHGATKHGRLHDLFVYHNARTGRAAGVGAQPQNFPNSGMSVSLCEQCKKHYKGDNICPWCGFNRPAASEIEWGPQAVEDALTIIKTGNLECVEYYFGDAFATISGCLRGLFVAAPGKDLICSDYSAIEAVVLAELAGESWRMEVFRTHGRIYELSASKITGVPFHEFLTHKQATGQHHPLRKTVGKVAELASGYGGWVGAWKAFGADEFFSDEQIKQSIIAWRDASPAIVDFWGGQEQRGEPCLYGLEGMAVAAIMDPGKPYTCRGITYQVRGDTLFCTLLSGRHIAYQKPRLSPCTRPYREKTLTISFAGWNSNPKYGAIGWKRMETYAGKLTENVVQATARDILAHAIVNLERAGYPVVLHVHDEIVSEVPAGYGSVEDFEHIMATLPAWADGWPVKAAGGWRAKRYAK